MDNKYDVIILGTGAGGGTIARALAASGKRILILERGGFLPRERENWDTRSVFVEKRYVTDERWYLDDQPFRPDIHYWVGGNTKMFGAALFRLREADFGEIVHEGGISPAWAISYDDLEPYYEIAERMYYVHGKAGVDPTEPRRNCPYPYEPLPHEPRIQQLEDDLRQLGYSPFPLPMGVRLGNEDGKQGAVTVLSQFDGFPDITEAKADSHVIGINPALAHENVTLKTHRYVERLETDASGRKVTHVIAHYQGEIETFEANTVIVACGAVNSAALFLRSKNDKHLNGLANSSGLVGRNYMCHNNATFLAISKKPNDSIFQKTLAISDFYSASADWEYPMGLIQMLGKSDAELMRFESPEPLGGMTHEDMARRSLDFWLQSEDLPDPDNRVTLNANNDIVFHYKKNNMVAHYRLTDKLKELLSYIGCHNYLMPVEYYLGTQLPFNLAHQCGTMKFGTDPTASVLDVNCRPHDLENVYVVDASFFPSAGAVNPSLTIIANALRVADYLQKEVL